MAKSGALYTALEEVHDLYGTAPFKELEESDDLDEVSLRLSELIDRAVRVREAIDEASTALGKL